MERTECPCVRLSKSFTAWAPDPQTRKASQSTFGPCAEKIAANPLLELQAHFWDSPGSERETEGKEGKHGRGGRQEQRSLDIK